MTSKIYYNTSNGQITHQYTNGSSHPDESLSFIEVPKPINILAQRVNLSTLTIQDDPDYVAPPSRNSR